MEDKIALIIGHLMLQLARLEFERAALDARIKELEANQAAEPSP